MLVDNTRLAGEQIRTAIKIEADRVIYRGTFYNNNENQLPKNYKDYLKWHEEINTD